MNQKRHWEKTYSNNPLFFGEEPSEFATAAVAVFSREGMQTVLELGCGHGRDTLLFARKGFEVTALDYSAEGLKGLAARAEEVGVSAHVATRSSDVRQMLPFPDGSFDACYSHMLLCMELSLDGLKSLVGEIRRVLRPGGLALYSVRNTFDPHYRTGIQNPRRCTRSGALSSIFSAKRRFEACPTATRSWKSAGCRKEASPGISLR